MSYGLDLMALRPFFVNDPPVTLYHYTSMRGLLGIVDSGRIWATHVDYLNDASEAQVLWRFVARYVGARLSAEVGESAKRLQRLTDLMKVGIPCSDFVASFSEDGDSLSQWRAYCADGAGVCIGFRSAALTSQWVAGSEGQESAFVGNSLNQVSYIAEDEDDVLRSELDQLLLRCELVGTMHGANGPISEELQFFGWIAGAASRFKHTAFSAEREWRLAMQKPHKPMPHQRFRPGKSTLLPYVEVELNRNKDHVLSSEYFIHDVRLSPGPSAALAREAVSRLFVAKGHPEVSVCNSSIPFRHW